jgi:hypothetical protein
MVGIGAMDRADQHGLRHDERAKHDGRKKVFGFFRFTEIQAECESIKEEYGCEIQTQKCLNPLDGCYEQRQQGNNAQPNHDWRANTAILGRGDKKISLKLRLPIGIRHFCISYSHCYRNA